ncbi:MAG: ABC transporter substrate-binding protein [Acetobacteraceae bacterium]
MQPKYRSWAAIALAAGLAALTPQPAPAQTVRAVMNGDLRSLDPLWTIAPQTRIHAYMVYDTLLGADEKMQIRPQMVDRWTESDDHLTYTFTLREKLAFSDGAPVTSADVIASLKRWMIVDSAGQYITEYLVGIDAPDARTFVIRLKAPFPQLIYSLGKPSAVPTFVYPARIVDGLPANKQFTDPTGSGPFIMRKEEWVTGSKVVYVKNPGYVPRDEPPSSIAGGKRVFVDRVEWLNITDPATQVAALKTGEIDFIQFAPPDILADLRKTKGIVVRPLWPVGIQGHMRLNWTNPPFDNQGIRRAIQNFVIQPDMIMAVMGNLEDGKVCGAMAMCGSAAGSEEGAELLLSNDPVEVRAKRGIEMMRAAGYRNEPIVLLDATDQVMQHNATLVLVDVMRRAGVNVDLQTVDWATVISRRTIKGPGPNGWHIIMTTGGQVAGANPAFSILAPARCEKSFPGWPCDQRYEDLRSAWLKEADPVKARTIAVEIQKRGMEIGHSIPYGEYLLPAAWRDSLEGVIAIPEHVAFWNMRKKN